MNTLKSLLPSSLFKPHQHKLALLGLDNAGKTTILYRLASHYRDKTNDIVTPIPTIGFNVESFAVGGVSFVGWDVGGCDQIRPLWRHYFDGLAAILFVVDLADGERMKEAVGVLRDLVGTVEGVPVVVLGNKRDLPNAVGVDVVRGEMSQIVGSMRVYATSATAAEWHETGLGPALEAVVDVVKGKVGGGKKNHEATLPTTNTVLEEYLRRQDVPISTFLHQLETYTLPSWDHYTHLRLAYTYLKRHGRSKGKDIIFSKIQDYIQNSGNTGKTKRFHLTLTYFWVQMVWLGMVRCGMAETAGEDGEIDFGEFKRLLRENPELTDGELVLEYYSPELIWKDPRARVEFVVPDRKGIPSVI